MLNSILKKNFLPVIITLTGLVVFLPAITFNGFLTTSQSLLIRAATIVVLTLGAFILKANAKLEKFRLIPILFLIASLSLFCSWFFSGYILYWLGLSTKTATGIAMTKSVESLLVIIPIFIIAKLFNLSIGSFYLHKGKLKVGLIIGILFFIFMYSISFFLARQGGYLEFFTKSTPWLLLFCFTNAFMEELLFRGIFLSHFGSLIGKGRANLITALVFTSAHIKIIYAPDMIFFLITLFVLALLWGFLIQKTESLVAATLFHAGADTIIFTGIVASMGSIA